MIYLFIRKYQNLLAIIAISENNGCLKFLRVKNVQKITLSVLETTIAICKFDNDTDISSGLLKSNFISITKTADELSIVCDQSRIQEESKAISIETNWRALKVEGPLDFSLTGVLSSLLQPLAEQKISIFALSTYDTDYILVKEKDLRKAVETLQKQYFIHESK